MTKKEKEEINELLNHELTYDLGMKKIVEILNIKSISINSHSDIDDFVGFKIIIHNRYPLLDIFLFETYSEFDKVWKLLSRLSFVPHFLYGDLYFLIYLPC